MAINYTVSYTFAPSTTISSSQVNTNFSDNANTWNGLEALTKSFAKLKLDVDPTTALEVATKQYVDHYSTWRYPRLVYGSATTVSVESGLDGTSGNIPMLFPDGTVRTETSTTRTTFDITRNCALSGSAQSGLRATLSEATNTWYALYAVKVTDTTTTWVTVGDTVVPIQANYATLNSNFGTNGWVYLGYIRNGDNSGATGDICQFYMSGNTTLFVNSVTAPVTNVNAMSGTVLASVAASTANLTYTYSAGTGTTNIPNTIGHVLWHVAMNGSAESVVIIGKQSPSTNVAYNAKNATNVYQSQVWSPATSGLIFVPNSVSSNYAIALAGFTDNVLGVGSHPLL